MNRDEFARFRRDLLDLDSDQARTALTTLLLRVDHGSRLRVLHDLLSDELQRTADVHGLTMIRGDVDLRLQILSNAGVTA